MVRDTDGGEVQGQWRQVRLEDLGGRPVGERGMLLDRPQAITHARCEAPSTSSPLPYVKA